MTRILVFFATLMLAEPAVAGAWMREVGSTFLSFSTTVDENGQLDGALYVEHGLRPKLTLGLKIDMDMTLGRMGDGAAFVFVRKPITLGERSYELAYEIGLGSTTGDGATALLRVALSYGRGVNLWDKPGWVAVDATVEWPTDDSSTTTKLDGTLGMNVSDRFQVMMQVFFTDTGSSQSTTLAPSMIWRAAPDGPTRYQVGIEAEDGSLGFKLGVWRTF